MDTTNDGLLGAIIIALIVYAGYRVAIKKSSWDLSGLRKIESPLTGASWRASAKWAFPILIGVAILYYRGFDTQLRPADMGNLGQEYWFQILIVYAIIASLIWINADEKSAKMLQKAAAGVVFTLLVVLPCWFWISSPSTSGERTVTSSLKIPDAGNDETKWPEPFWTTIELSKEAESELLPVKVGKRLVMFGKKDFSVNCIYRNGHKTSFGKGEQPCPNGDMPWNSVTNKAGEPNIIYLAYRPI